MLICPKCKLLYEKSTKCIRCGSPLVEKTSYEKEETKAPPPLESNKETPPIQKSKDKKEELRSTPLYDFEEKFPPTPKPKADLERRSPTPPFETEFGATEWVKKEEPETDLTLNFEKALRGVLTDEQSSSKITPNETKFEEKFPPKPTLKVDPEELFTTPPSKKELGAAERVKKGEPGTESLSDMGNPLHQVLRDEQSSPDILPSKTKSEISRSEKIQIRIPNLTYQKISIIILILIGGYLLWSIYSHFTPKKPSTNVSPSKEPAELLSPRPATPAKRLTPLIEPKVADDKKPSISEKETIVSPPTHSPPIASKTSLSDEKETEYIKKLFENIRNANLRKDIDLFISCYSSAFKDRERKKREVLKNWETFTYINLSYTLRKYSISGDTAGVKIAWVILYSSKAGGPVQESKTVLDITLNKEPTGWKIRNIKTAS